MAIYARDPSVNQGYSDFYMAIEADKLRIRIRQFCDSEISQYGVNPKRFDQSNITKDVKTNSFLTI